MKVLFAIVALAMLAGGCAVIEKITGPTVARTVSKYCETPRDARLVLRSEVNKLAAPNSIKVCCKGDPDEASCTQ